ncbi:LysR family transcriptional regulator [Sphingomonas melonis]|uniref:DNA-binding transcriptional LysR family regulator n=1 Tax=Sphingomonas melonis TaxID=152682 RepID=A0A7Y9K3G3_9SPHN|nr:LysR family transcriptional regulator [Sphingomonas melonis]NYD90335.1 DNA-binding transcriptional LysR family regulator [Sphingomonas melonis]
MTRRLPDFEAWAIFAKVAERGSFAGAAQALGLANPTVSKAIARLEARLGVALLSRTSRRLSLTEAGRSALARAGRILQEGEALEDEAAEQSDVARGLVRISAPLSFGTAYVGATLPEFLAAYPEITLDFALSDRRVDLVAEGFDLALRIAALEDSSLLARRLCTVRILLVAAPGYLDTHGRPSHPAQLQHHCALAYTGGTSRGVWRFAHPQFGEETVEPPVRVWTDNADMLNPALLAGQGLALQPEFLVWRELREGRLEVAMPEWSVAPLGLHLITPPSPLRPRRVQVLIDHFARALAKAPWAAAS